MSAKTFLAHRETKFVPVETDGIRLDGHFSGYASLFGKVDQGNDVVMPGAFKKSLENRKSSDIRMLFQHDPDQPIGVWKQISEDPKGLYVEGQITRGVKRGEEVLELMRGGALDGLSIGFRTKQARTNPRTKVRHIIAADLWEISVVTFPLLEGARINAVKSSVSPYRKPTMRELEKWLTRDAGLSRRDARRMMANGYHAIDCKRDAAAERPLCLAQKIREATHIISTRS